jgi:primosomal protein N' (replication factor Y)
LQDPDACAVGSGSERLQEDLQNLLPGIRIGRLDSDLSQKANYLIDTLTKFRNLEMDILVGTQMLAKGHDFPKVSLLVLLELDQILSFPDFRAAESTFQLLVQAAGRAGRSEIDGEVILQTYQESHPIVQLAKTQDFKGFALRELELRKAFSYPPFHHLAAIEMSHINEGFLNAQMELLGRHLFAIESNQSHEHAFKIMGPATPPIEKIKKMHRRQIVISSASRAHLQKLLISIRGYMETHLSKVPFKINIDPQSLL